MVVQGNHFSNLLNVCKTSELHQHMSFQFYWHWFCHISSSQIKWPLHQLSQWSSCSVLSLKKYSSEPPVCSFRTQHPSSPQCHLACWRSQGSWTLTLFLVPEYNPHMKIRLLGNFNAGFSSTRTIHHSLLIVLDFLHCKKRVSCWYLLLVFVLVPLSP